MGAPTRDDTGVDLFWLPLGAGGRLGVVRLSGRWYERVAARRQHRDPLRLYHSALEVRLDGRQYVIESAPAWGNGRGDHGVVACGPVGLVALGRSRFFRYEVRCWADGVLPDRDAAVGGPRRLSRDPLTAGRVLALAPAFPTATWGRDEFGTGEMWNSNSLVSWVLAVSGVDLSDVAPPPGGRAPGWTAGTVVAARGTSATPLRPRIWRLRQPLPRTSGVGGRKTSRGVAGTENRRWDRAPAA